MVDEPQVRSLGPRLPAGHVDSLEHLTAEQAAVALTDLFLRTGSAQARVNDPDQVRRLVRRDCRRRAVSVRTLSVENVVVVHEDHRYEAFIATAEGAVYQDEMEERVRHAMAKILPTSLPRLRPAPPLD